MRTITGKEAIARGRDLDVMTLEVVSETTRTPLGAVVCPKEHRARPVDDCVACPDGRGPSRDPGARPGFVSCAGDGPDPAPRDDAASPADRTLVTAVMTRAAVGFCLDLTLDVARREMVERELDAVPVVDHQGRPLGLLSNAELVHAADRPVKGDVRVGDVMNRRLFPIADTARVSDVAAVMAAEGTTSVPVVAREGRVVGIVTALDLVAWLAAQDDRGARKLP